MKFVPRWHDAFTLPLRRTLEAEGHHLRKQLFYITLAWGFGSFWLWTISGAAMTQFARALSMPDYGFGILAALPFIGTLAQLPASYVLDRFGYRKSIFISTAIIGRGMWIAAALVPWIIPGLAHWWWPMMVLALLLSWVFMQMSAPAWMNWMSDVIPRSLRGRYFGNRNLVGQVVGLFAAVGVGYLLDLPGPDNADLMLKLTSGLIFIAGIMGVLDIATFFLVDDPTPPVPQKDVSLMRSIRQVLGDRNLRYYLAFNFLFMFGIGFIGQYAWLYVFDVVGWSNSQANFLIIVIPLVVRMIGYPFWGRLIDRFGKKPILLLTGCVVSVGSMGWLFVTPDTMLLGYTMILIVTFAWPGMEIANFNFLIDLSGSGRRAGSRRASVGQPAISGTATVAIASIVIAVGGILSGLMAAGIARTMGDFVYHVPLLGMVLTYHGLLFLGSTAIRMASLLYALKLEEPRAAPAREAIRYVSSSLWTNVRTAALLPARTMGQSFTWTYRVNHQWRRQRAKERVRLALDAHRRAHEKLENQQERALRHLRDQAERAQRRARLESLRAQARMQEARQQAERIQDRAQTRVEHISRQALERARYYTQIANRLTEEAEMRYAQALQDAQQQVAQASEQYQEAERALDALAEDLPPPDLSEDNEKT